MDNIDQLKISLGSLGISDFDTKAYLAILDKGTTTISSLARTLQVERPTIYAALERLQQKGLMTSDRSAYSRELRVEPPNRIISLFEKQKSTLDYQEKTLESVLPELMAEFAVKGQTRAFRLFEGKDQFITIYEEILKEAKDEVQYFGDAKTFIDYVGPEYDQNWIKRRIKKRIFIKVLAFQSDLSKSYKLTDKQEYRETRLLPKDTYFESSYMLYGAKTLIWNPLADRAIVIEDAIVTEMFKQVFDLLWNKAK